MRATPVVQILATLKGAFVAADSRGKIVSLNAAASGLLGWPAGALEGRPITSIIPERMREAHRQGFERFLTTGGSRIMGRPVRVPALGQDGEERDVDLTILAYEDPIGQRTLIAGLAAPGGPTVEVLDLEAILARSDYRSLIQPDRE